MGQEDLQRRAARIGRVILHPGHGSHTSLDSYVRALLRYKYDEATGIPRAAGSVLLHR